MRLPRGTKPQTTFTNQCYALIALKLFSCQSQRALQTPNCGRCPVSLGDLMTVCLSANLERVCRPATCLCPSLQQQQQQQSANLPMNALGPLLGPQLASSQTPLHTTPPPAASSASTAGGVTNLTLPQPSTRSTTPTLPGPAQGATPPRPTQPQPQVELPAAAQTQAPLQPPTTPVRQRPSACPPLCPLPRKLPSL